MGDNSNHNLPNETKFCDGIYVTKINNNNNKEQNNNFINIEGEKFIYHNTEELLTILEAEFNEFGEIVQKLFESNEEMLKFDPKDYDLIQARQENLEIIQIKIKSMKDIQNKIKNICPHHPIINVDIFSLFINENKNEEKNEDNKKDINIMNDEGKNTQNDLILNMINEIPSLINNTNENNNNENNNNEKNNENDIITEIDL